MNVRNNTKDFYDKFEDFVVRRGVQNDVDLSAIKNVIFRDLDDLIATEDEVDLGKRIGIGASSEVYYGNFKFCPCAVKKIKLNLMNAKQLVTYFFIFSLKNFLRKIIF